MHITVITKAKLPPATANDNPIPFYSASA